MFKFFQVKIFLISYPFSTSFVCAVCPCSNPLTIVNFHFTGFSRQMIELLNAQGAKYNHFDILTDNDVRQGMDQY